jgi:hypothetical protein
MSADTPTRRPQGDASGGTADQVKPAATPADAHRQRGDAHPRQPADTGLRQDHADAMLARPPGRTRETSARGTPAGRDSRQAGQAQPERSPAPKPEAGQHNGHRPEGRLRQDHADAMLAGAAGRPRSGEAEETTRAAGKRASPHDSQNGRPASAAADSQPHAPGRHDRRDPAAARPAETAVASRAQGHGDTWPPPQADRDSARALYAEDFGSRHAAVGRDRGANVVGDKPARSPGDTSDLPPTGAELVETADEDKPRMEKFSNAFYKGFDDIDDGAKTMVTSAKEFLDQPPPTGHAAVVADTHAHWVPESTPDATPGVGDVMEVVLVAGVLADRAFHWVRNRVNDKTGRANADASH